MDRDNISVPYSKITHICSYGKKKGQPFASTGGVKTEETARAIAKGAAANATYVAAVLTMKPLSALLLVIGLKSDCLGVLPPRLLQGHSPSGEPQCKALVGNATGSGEELVKFSGVSCSPNC